MSIKELYEQGYSVDEIAFSLNMSVWVVKSTVTKLGISRPRGNYSATNDPTQSYCDLLEQKEAAGPTMALDICHLLARQKLNLKANNCKKGN